MTDKKMKFLLEKKGWKTMEEEKKNPTVITRDDLKSYKVTPNKGGKKIEP